MSENNEDFYRGEGNPEIGEELRTFFLKLLADPEALRRYYDRGERGLLDDDTPRGMLIAEQEMSDEARELLKNGTLKEIEEHILAIPGSYAKPLHIVWML